MNTLYVVDYGSRLVRNADGLMEAQDRPAHKNYTACCPEDIASKLKGRGYTINRRIRGRQAFLEARLPGGDFGEYAGVAKIAFDHAGKASVRIAPGALRMACYNQFTSGNQIRLHHCGTDIERFIARPWEFLEDLLEPARNMAHRIERLRRVQERNLGRRWIHCLLGGHRGLLRKSLSWYRFYVNRNFLRPGPWAALQAFTNTRSPALERATSDLLTNHFEDLVRGRVPEYALS